MRKMPEDRIPPGSDEQTVNPTVVFHIDLDAFYATVEQLDHPEFRGKPVVVGARPGTRGVVSAASYEARRYGIRSAMPISEAYRRCPSAVFVPVRMARYQEVSRRVMQLLAEYAPSVEQLSVDEAFLDVTGTERLFGAPEELARTIKQEIHSRYAVTASVGVAPNRFLAKIASDVDKPDGLCVVPPGTEREFTSRRDLTELWGVGKRTLHRLKSLGITTVPELQTCTKPFLRGHFGQAAGEYLYCAARGIDPGVFHPHQRSRSMSTEQTFERDVTDKSALEEVLLELSEQIAFRMHDEQVVSNTVVLKLRTDEFVTRTAQRRTERELTSTEDCYTVGKLLLDKLWDRKPIRLIGLGVADVYPVGSIQGELFDDGTARRRAVEEAVRQVSRKLGTPIHKARLMRPRDPDSHSSE